MGLDFHFILKEASKQELHQVLLYVLNDREDMITSKKEDDVEGKKLLPDTTIKNH